MNESPQQIAREASEESVKHFDKLPLDYDRTRLKLWLNFRFLSAITKATETQSPTNNEIEALRWLVSQRFLVPEKDKKQFVLVLSLLQRLSQSSAAPASAEQREPFHRVLRLFGSTLLELADRLEYWARVGSGSKEHCHDCEDAAQIIRAVTAQPQKERTGEK